MSRQRVDRQGRMETREALWAAIRRLGSAGEFTAKAVRLETRCSRDQTERYIRGLTRAGILEVKRSGKPGRPNYYRLARDPGAEAPRVRADGSEARQGRGRAQMWKTMRILRDFTVRDLAVHAATEEHQPALGEVETYCGYLARAGYLRRRGEVFTFLRSRWTGPRAPMIQRVKQVYDPNLGEVVWRQGEPPYIPRSTGGGQARGPAPTPPHPGPLPRGEREKRGRTRRSAPTPPSIPPSMGGGRMGGSAPTLGPPCAPTGTGEGDERE